MEISTNRERDIIRDNKLELMALKLLQHGFKIFHMDLEFSSVPMVSLFKVFGIMESFKGMENIMEKMVHIKETGKTISLMDLEFKLGQMEANSKEIVIRASNMGMENIYGLTNQHMKGTGLVVK